MYNSKELNAQLNDLKQSCIDSIIGYMNTLPSTSYKISKEIIYATHDGNDNKYVFEFIERINTIPGNVVVNSIHGYIPVPFKELNIKQLIQLVEELELEIDFRKVKIG